MTDHINNLDDVADVPKCCPECGGDWHHERFDEERDTGVSACWCWSCAECDVHFTAPPPRNEH